MVGNGQRRDREAEGPKNFSPWHRTRSITTGNRSRFDFPETTSAPSSPPLANRYRIRSTTPIGGYSLPSIDFILYRITGIHFYRFVGEELWRVALASMPGGERTKGTLANLRQIIEYNTHTGEEQESGTGIHAIGSSVKDGSRTAGCVTTYSAACIQPTVRGSYHKRVVIVYTNTSLLSCFCC